MEEILHDINRQIGLNEVTIKKNNAFLKQVSINISHLRNDMDPIVLFVSYYIR